MGVLTFKGGIHPYDGKELSMDKPIKTVLPKGDLIFPIQQHIGAPANPIVEKKDRVLAGQKIAEAGGFISAPIHSSVSGTVKAIEPRLTVQGNKILSIVIENDNQYEEFDYGADVKPVDQMTKEEIREKIKEAGIVGLGGAGFPTYVKLTPKPELKIDYIIVNGSECEPYLTSDYRRMMEDPDKLIEGLKIILRLFDGARGYIAIEDNKPEAIKILTEKTKSEENIEIKTVKTKYPEGAERQLISALTGKKINSSMLPADAGCIVDNVETVIAVYYAVTSGKPLIEKVITVTGDAIAIPQNFMVRTGMNYYELVEEAGGFKEQPAQIISGGPMMGISLFNVDVPVTKTSSALLCMSKDDVARYEPTNCIHCGRCVDVCPEHLVSSYLADFSLNHEEEKFIKYNGLECCECGCCSYVCPAKRRLTQSIKTMRRRILAKNKKNK